MSKSSLFRFLAALCVSLLLTACAGTGKTESTGEYIDDTVITTRVKAALVKDPIVSAVDVSVESFKGAVQLRGFVKTAAQRDRAVKIAAETPGVTQVINAILLR